MGKNLTLTDGQSPDWRTLLLQDNPDQAIDIVMHLFKRFDAMWTNRWRREQHEPDAWVASLSEFTFGAVSHAEQLVKEQFDVWPPSLAQFMALARQWVPLIEDRLALPQLERKRSTPEFASRHLSEIRKNLGLKTA